MTSFLSILDDNNTSLYYNKGSSFLVFEIVLESDSILLLNERGQLLQLPLLRDSDRRAHFRVLGVLGDLDDATGAVLATSFNPSSDTLVALTISNVIITIDNEGQVIVR